MAAEGKPRRTNVESYLDYVNLTVDVLDGLAREMRTRRPTFYYSEH